MIWFGLLNVQCCPMGVGSKAEDDVEEEEVAANIALLLLLLLSTVVVGNMKLGNCD